MSTDLCIRSSRVKKCSGCGEIFTRSGDLTRHMRCHIELSPYICSYCGKYFDNYEDCKAHKEGKRGVSNQNPQVKNEFTQENSLGYTNITNQDNTVMSREISELPTVTDASASLQTAQACKPPLTCQECGQSFSYYTSFDKEQGKCSKSRPRREKQTNTKYCFISACNFPSVDDITESCTETSSETKANKAGQVDESQTKSSTMKCTVSKKNFSEIILMKRHYSKSHKI